MGNRSTPNTTFTCRDSPSSLNAGTTYMRPRAGAVPRSASLDRSSALLCLWLIETTRDNESKVVRIVCGTHTPPCWTSIDASHVIVPSAAIVTLRDMFRVSADPADWRY